jgi:hypothetical protein
MGRFSSIYSLILQSQQIPSEDKFGFHDVKRKNSHASKGKRAPRNVQYLSDSSGFSFEDNQCQANGSSSGELHQHDLFSEDEPQQEEATLECTPVREEEDEYDDDEFEKDSSRSDEETEDERAQFLSRPKRMANNPPQSSGEEDSGSGPAKEAQDGDDGGDDDDTGEDDGSSEESQRKEGMVSVPVLDGCHSIHQMGVKKSGYHWIKTGRVLVLIFSLALSIS